MENSERRPKCTQMKCLQNTQKYFAALGIGPDLATQPHPINLKLFIGGIILAITYILVVIYVFSEAETFVEYTRSIYICAFFNVIISVLLTIILNVKTLYELIDIMDAIINTGKWKFNWLKLISFNNNFAFRIKIFGDQSNFPRNQSIRREIEWTSVFYCCKIDTRVYLCAMGRIHLLHLFYHRCGKWHLRTTISNVVSIWTKNWIVEIWFDCVWNTCDIECRFPFNLKTSVGFTVAIAIQFGGISYVALVGACALNMAVGGFLYAIAMAKCVKRSLLTINKKAHSKTHRNRIPDQLNEVLQFHSLAKQLSWWCNLFKILMGSHFRKESSTSKN